MILDTEKQASNSLAAEILNLDPGILSCVLTRSPQGAILTKAVKSESRNNLGKLSGETEGMAAHWALLAFNSMKRLDAERSKTKYIVVGREEYKTLIFPASLHGSNIMLILTSTLQTNVEEIYTRIMKIMT
jgi:hypothetical protein